MHSHSHTTSIERSGRISAILAVACAIHCALMPLAITLLPLLGMQFLASHAFELGMLGIGLGFGIYGVAKGFRTHKDQRPVAVVVLGSVLILMGLFVVPESLEHFFVPVGAVCLGAAQIINIRLLRVCKNCQA